MQQADLPQYRSKMSAPTLQRQKSLLASINFQPTFTSLPSRVSSFRFVIEEKIAAAGGVSKERLAYKGPECAVKDAERVDYEPVRLVIVPNNDITLTLSLTSDGADIASRTLSLPELLQYRHAGDDESKGIEMPLITDGPPGSDASIADQLYGDAAVTLIPRLSTTGFEDGAAAGTASPQTTAAAATTKANGTAAAALKWVEFASFARPAGASADHTATLTLSLSAEGMFPLDPLAHPKPASLASVHDAHTGKLIDHSDIVEGNAPAFTQQLRIKVPSAAAVPTKTNASAPHIVVFRVYDAADAILETPADLIGQTESLRVSALIAAAKGETKATDADGTAITLPLSLPLTCKLKANVEKKLRVKNSSLRITAATFDDPHATAAGTSAAVAPLMVSPSEQLAAPHQPTSIQAGGEHELVFVDPHGHEHRRPHVSEKTLIERATATESKIAYVKLKASNLIKMDPLGSTVCSVVAIWRKRTGADRHNSITTSSSAPAAAATLPQSYEWILVDHTEVELGSEVEFKRELIVPQPLGQAKPPGGAAAPAAAADSTEYRIDVYDSSDSSLSLDSETMGSAMIPSFTALCDLKADTVYKLTSTQTDVAKKLERKHTSLSLSVRTIGGPAPERPLAEGEQKTLWGIRKRGSIDFSHISPDDYPGLLNARRVLSASHAKIANDMFAYRKDRAAPSVLMLELEANGIRNTGAFVPLVGVYEQALLASSSASSSSDAWLLQDFTDKHVVKAPNGAVSPPNESSRDHAQFKKRIIIPLYNADSDEQKQIVRFDLYNAGASDIASASDLIASSAVQLQSLLTRLQGAADHTVSLPLHSKNKLQNDRLNRQSAHVKVHLLHVQQPSEVSAGDANANLVLPNPPLPTTIQGGINLVDMQAQPAALSRAPSSTAAAGSAAEAASSAAGTDVAASAAAAAASVDASAGQHQRQQSSESNAGSAQAPDLTRQSSTESAAGGDKKKKKKKKKKKTGSTDLTGAAAGANEDDDGDDDGEASASPQAATSPASADAGASSAASAATAAAPAAAATSPTSAEDADDDDEDDATSPAGAAGAGGPGDAAKKKKKKNKNKKK